MLGLGLSLTPGSGGAAGITNPGPVDAGVTGPVAQLKSALKGTLTWSKLSGASAIAIAASGAVTLSTALAAGASASATVRVANTQGDAIERTITISAVGAATPTPTPTPTPTTYHILSFSGQSNAEGNGSNGQTADADYVELTNWGLWNGSNATARYRAGVNSHGNGPNAPSGQYWGPEAEMMRRIAAAHPDWVGGIHKFCEGGTGLASSGSLHDWNANSAGDLNDQYIASLQAHVAWAQAQGYTVVIEAEAFTQSEADSQTQADALAYATNLPDMIAKRRAAIGAVPFIFARMRTGVAGLDYIADVQAGQRTVALTVANTVCVFADDIPTATALHPGPAGYRELGDRYFAAYAGTLAPTVLSSSAASTPENGSWSMQLQALSPVTWTIDSGADAGLFALSGGTLSLAAKDYELPTDSDANNTYLVNVRATQPNGQYTTRTVTVTITNVAEGSTYENETDGLLQRLTGSYSAQQKDAMNTLVKGLKENGIWAKTESFSVFRQAKNATDALLDWTRSASHTNSGATFAAASGFTTNGTSTFLTLDVDLSAASKATIASVGFQIGVTAFTMGANKAALGSGGSKTVLYASSATAAVLGIASATPATLAGVTDLVGRWSAQRINSAYTWSVNGGGRTSISSSSASAFPTTAGSNLVLGRLSPTSGIYGAGTFSYVAFGQALTQAEEAAFDGLVAAYLAATFA